MDNIAEGFSRGGTNEFMQFLRIARGSVGELQSQLYRALDRDWITEKEFKMYYNTCHVISRKCYNLIQHLMQSDKKGPNYQNPK
jgi:four helix bundle protein